jgi:hypothetical protein
LREAHHARRARGAGHQHRTTRGDSVPGVGLRGGAARIATAK